MKCMCVLELFTLNGQAFSSLLPVLPSYEVLFVSLVLEGEATSSSTATGTDENSVSCCSAVGLCLFSELPQSRASEWEHTDLPGLFTSGHLKEKTNYSLIFGPPS